SDAFLTGTVWQTIRDPAGARVRYGWEQRAADPSTGRAVNAMHFRVHPRRGKPRRLDDAFVYDWRLWSVPELRDAMLEAGFARADVYPRTPAALDHEGVFHAAPVEDPSELGDSFCVYVVARRP